MVSRSYSKLVNGYFLYIEVKRIIIVDPIVEDTFTFLKGNINVVDFETVECLASAEIDFNDNGTPSEAIKSNLIKMFKTKKLPIARMEISYEIKHDLRDPFLSDNFYDKFDKLCKQLEEKDNINRELVEEIYTLVK